jgi:hypothetical protein
MDIFAQFATDPAKEIEGTWKQIGNAKFLIARWGNTRFQKRLQKLMEQNKHTLDQKTDESDKLGEALLIDAMSTTILLNWENVEYKGAPLSYEAKNVVTVLNHKDFRAEIVKLAEDFESYKAEEEAKAKKL